MRNPSSSPILALIGIVALGLTACSTPEEALITVVEPESADSGDGGSGTDSPRSSIGRSDGPASTPEPEPSGAGARSAEAPAEGSGEFSFGDAETSSAGTGRGASRTSVSGLLAGYSDDNQQFNLFLSFLERYGYVEHRELRVQERIKLVVTDRGGRSLPNAVVRLISGDSLLSEGSTFADGTHLFFPNEHASESTTYIAEISYGGMVEELIVDRQGPRSIEVQLDIDREPFQDIPLDILFILDTTGSMGEEIDRLKTTIEIINLNLIAHPASPHVRFGMVLYKDRGEEEYLTRVIHLTDDLQRFQTALNSVTASGGGDTPEDLESALRDAMTEIRWSSKGVRLGFVITDAAPHLSQYAQDYPYTTAARDARLQAVKLFTIGTGGLDLMGEYVLRQIAQFTSAKYIFLTYGERGESEGGRTGSVSHHTGSNFQTDSLESIVIRFAKEELGHLAVQQEDQIEDYFLATKIDGETTTQTLDKLFERSLAQLIDYSSIRIAEDTPTALLPLVPVTEGLADRIIGLG